LQYPHFLESICLTSYSEHEINILKNSFVSRFTTLSQNDVCIACLLGFARVMQCLFQIPKYMLWNPKVLCDTPERGSACELSSFGHEQYPSDNLNQNN